MITQIFAATFTSMAFALILNVPPKYYAQCGFIGGFGWFLYLLIAQTFWDSVGANFIASLVIVFLSRLSAHMRSCPLTVFAVPSLIPLIPGGSIFLTMYYFAMDQNSLAQVYGLGAIKTSLAIAFALIIILELPQEIFMFMNRQKYWND